MLFHAPIFFLFFAAFAAVYLTARGPVGRKWILLGASYLFYAHWDWRYLSLLLISTFVDFNAAKRIEGDGARRKAWLVLSLVTNLGLLGVFKYGNFLVDSAAPLLDAAGLSVGRLPTDIPVGISFYTFQTMSYSIDVYRRQTPCARSPIDFALFVSFFPQLVAGPIVRSKELLPQLGALPPLSVQRLAEGGQRFFLGLFKKVVLADNASLFVDSVFADPSAASAPTLWLGAYAFALQIYGDFSGYTDMALGLGRALGIDLPENFRTPYISKSITEFWRRWHISLSSWLRDYLYIPLGGSRGSTVATYRNLMLTMLLGGLWHGAAWNFVVWGAFHGGLLAIERALGLGEAPKGARGFLRMLVTFHLVMIGWVVFRATSAANMTEYVAGLFTNWSDLSDVRGAHWALILGAFVVLERLAVARGFRATIWDRLPAFAQGAVLASVAILVGLFHVEDVAFIYFQF